ncbi:hypothetical protein LTR53_006020 [Teratosphaeriaceae sp. CCFEE 6253]|nr:hypothetical protein LTR53_006020 [Teratosphaeriaceae sp. CCFEE 6253]
MEDVPKQAHLLPAAVDYRAKHSPDTVFAVLPKDDKLEDGFFDLTYAALAKAVNALAWWLDEVLGTIPATEKFKDFPTVPYIGADDFRYVLLVLAAMKTGRKAMFSFPANTPEGLARLLELSQSKVTLASACHKHIWSKPLADKPEIRTIEVPGVDTFVHDRPVEPYAYDRTYDEGTTGTPKPIVWSNRWIEEYIGDVAVLSRHAPADQKSAVYALCEGTRVPNLLPLSWGAGILLALQVPLFAHTVPVMLPPASIPNPPTADFIKAIGTYAPKGPRNGMILVPDMLRHLVREAAGRESLQQNEWIAYVGAPLDHATGDALTALGIRVQSMIGATDIGLYNILLNDPQGWKIHRFPAALHNYYLDRFADGLYELCTARMPNDPRHVFASAPELDVYRTRDLWRAVPGREGYWSNAGRVDDFVKLASMTKFNAIAIEQIVEASPAVAKCLVAGDSRLASFILVEPAPGVGPYDATPDSEVIERVWPAIAAANEHLLPEARLSKELTVITLPGKPIIRTAKATVQRRASLEIYEKKIEAAYAAAGYAKVPFTIWGEAIGDVGKANGHAR